LNRRYHKVVYMTMTIPFHNGYEMKAGQLWIWVIAGACCSIYLAIYLS
jgi:hypothetical protein